MDNLKMILDNLSTKIPQIPSVRDRKKRSPTLVQTKELEQFGISEPCVAQYDKTKWKQKGKFGIVGTVYLSVSSICFYGKVFARKKKAVISFSRISGLKLKNKDSFIMTSKPEGEIVI